MHRMAILGGGTGGTLTADCERPILETPFVYQFTPG
jgi:hypothetical protein